MNRGVGMNIALSVWSCHKSMYDQSWTNADFIRFAAEAGADGVELLSVFWDKETDVPAVRQALAETGLRLACFGACNNLALSDAAAREAQVKDITDSVDWAVLFGASVVRVFSGDKSDDVTYEEAEGWIIGGLKEAADYAARKGVTLCLENHGYFAGKPEQVETVVSQVNSQALRSTFDTGNFLLVDADPNEAVLKLKHLASHIHVKDFAAVSGPYDGNIYQSLSGSRYAGKICGEGDVDLPFILSEFLKQGYEGWMTIEFEGDEEQRYGSTRSIANLRQLLKEQSSGMKKE